MQKRKSRLPPAKTGRTLQQVIDLLKLVEMRLVAARPAVEAAMDAVYEGHPAPEHAATAKPFYGSFWLPLEGAEPRLVVYNFGWSDYRGALVQAWSHSFHDSPDEPELLRRAWGKTKRLDPMEQMIWSATWEDRLGMTKADKVKALHDALRRESDLYRRRTVIMKALSRALACYDTDQPRYERKGGVRYQVGGELFTSTSNGLYHGDPDVYVTVDPSANIYHHPLARLPSWELQDRAHKRKI